MSMMRCKWWLTNFGMRGRAFSLAIWRKGEGKRRRIKASQDDDDDEEEEDKSEFG